MKFFGQYVHFEISGMKTKVGNSIPCMPLSYDIKNFWGLFLDFVDKKIKQCHSQLRSADFATFVIKIHEFGVRVYHHCATQSDDLTAFASCLICGVLESREYLILVSIWSTLNARKLPIF